MNRLTAFLLIASLAAQGQGLTIAGGVQGRNTDPRMTNEQVISMCKAGLSQGTIVRAIEQRGQNFDLSPEALIDLKKSGVSDAVMEAMVGKAGGSVPALLVKKTYTLKEGSEVLLKFADTVTSKTAQDGDPIEFLLAEDVRSESAVLVRSGARAVGTVTHAKKNGMMGKPGELSIALDYLKAGDSRVKLRATQGREGKDKVGTTIVLVVLFGVLGFMKHGSNAQVAEGTRIKAFVAQDTALPVLD